MNPIGELIAEHEGIKVSLEILSRMATRLNEPGNTVDYKDIEHLIEFYRTFVDACHHGKEEELLFPALEAIGVSREGGPIGVMLREHDIGRAHVRELDRILHENSGPNGSFAVNFRKEAEEYIQLLLGHIGKENGVLFPIADQHLPSREKEAIADGFERIERERIGIGKHEEFHKMLDDLRRKYLS